MSHSQELFGKAAILSSGEFVFYITSENLESELESKLPAGSTLLFDDVPIELPIETQSIMEGLCQLDNAFSVSPFSGLMQALCAFALEHGYKAGYQEGRLEAAAALAGQSVTS